MSNELPVYSFEHFQALLAQWEARRALIEHEARPTGLVAWREKHIALALELSKAEAALIALEDAHG